MRKFSRQLSEDCSHKFNWNLRALNSASSFLTDAFYTAEGDALQYQQCFTISIHETRRFLRSRREGRGSRGLRNNTDRAGLQQKDRIVKQHPDSASL